MGSEDISCIKDLFEFIEADWGYQNKFEEKSINSASNYASSLNKVY